VDSNAKCNGLESLGSSTKSWIFHSKLPPFAGFYGTKAAPKEGISSGLNE